MTKVIQNIFNSIQTQIQTLTLTLITIGLAWLAFLCPPKKAEAYDPEAKNEFAQYVMGQGSLDDLPVHNNLSRENSFRFKTESHRLRISRYMVYLLNNKHFLRQFPGFRKLKPYVNEVIELAHAHDNEKSPDRVNKMLTRYNGVARKDMNSREQIKFDKNIQNMNHSGEAKLNKILNKVGWVDSAGTPSSEARLYYALEGWVDRWDAATFRAREFGKPMEKTFEYIKKKLIPSGFKPKNYDLNLVAKMDEWSYQNPKLIKLSKVVEDLTPEKYLRMRSNFQWLPFKEVQKVYTEKLNAQHKITQRMNPDTYGFGRQNPKGINESSSVAVIGKPSVSPLLGRALDISAVVGGALAVKELSDPRKTETELGNDFGVGGVNTVPSLIAFSKSLSGGAAAALYSVPVGDDMAARYSDPQNYSEFLNLPLDQQEIIIKGNETMEFKSAIYSRRPQILGLQCSPNFLKSKEPVILEVKSLERQSYKIKVQYGDDGKVNYIVGTPLSEEVIAGNQIRLNLSSNQACFKLLKYNDAQYKETAQCTLIDSKGVPDLAPDTAQYLTPDHWNETVKFRDWLAQYGETLSECCHRVECRQHIESKNINKDKNKKSSSERTLTLR